MTIPNHITLDDLRNMQIGEIVALSAEQLALLQDAANEVLRSAKTTSDWLEGAITLKYTDRAVMARMEASKDTGTVRFDDGAVTVIADLPKRVDWDQDKLAALVERIRAEGDDPAEYVDVAIKVPERKFAAWPSHIRSDFEDARTVRTGKPSFRLSLNTEVTS
jgi:disulfide oxidoreductase YuzD